MDGVGLNVARVGLGMPESLPDAAPRRRTRLLAVTPGSTSGARRSTAVSWREAYELLDAAAPHRTSTTSSAWRSPPTSSARTMPAPSVGAGPSRVPRRRRPRAGRPVRVLARRSRSLLRGEMAHGSGWLARAERLVEDAGPACAARGFLLVPASSGRSRAGDAERRRARWPAEIVDIARRCGDRDLLALGMLGRGQVLARARARSPAGCGCSTRRWCR